MDSLWEFNAPQYVDFANVDQDEAADEYFDVDHEMDADPYLTSADTPAQDPPHNPTPSSYPVPNAATPVSHTGLVTEDQFKQEGERGTVGSSAREEVSMTCSPAPPHDDSTYTNARSTPATVARLGTRGGLGGVRRSTRSAARQVSTPERVELEGLKGEKQATGRLVSHIPMNEDVEMPAIIDPAALNCSVISSAASPLASQLSASVSQLSALHIPTSPQAPVSLQASATATEPSAKPTVSPAQEPAAVEPCTAAQDSVLARSTQSRLPAAKGLKFSHSSGSLPVAAAAASRGRQAATAQGQQLAAVLLRRPRAGSVEPANTLEPSAAVPNPPRTRSRSQADLGVGSLAGEGSGERSAGGKLGVKLTLPQTPSFMKRAVRAPVRIGAAVQSWEEREQHKVRELRAALAHTRRLAAESCVRALQPLRVDPTLSTFPLTRPHGFHFLTDARVKGGDGGVGVGGAEWKEVDFVRELRKHNKSASPAAVPRGRTVPQPFKLHEPPEGSRGAPKRKLSSADDKFETVAEKVVKFCSKTPDRFHTRARSESRERVGRNSGGFVEPPRGPTVPKTPTLMTRGRTRPNTAVSQAELDKREFEEMKLHQFKAHPVNERALRDPVGGIPKVESRPATVPRSFELESEKRIEARRGRGEEGGEPARFEFHAQPVPEAVLHGPVALKPAKLLPLTVPQSPAFVSKYLLRSAHPTTPQEDKQFHALPVPHVGIAFQPKLARHTTAVEPFSFEERDEAQRVRREEKLQGLLREEARAREFHANPIVTESVLPAKRVKPATKPEPFQFEVDRRGALKEIDFTQKVQQQQQSSIARFRARSATVLKKAPYAPVKCTKPVTEVASFALSTAQRADQRAQWEAWAHAQQSDAHAERAERELRQAEEQATALRRARAQAVPPAQPIRAYKPVTVLPSDLPLTVPETPAFSERLRARAQRQ